MKKVLLCISLLMTLVISLGIAACGKKDEDPPKDTLTITFDEESIELEEWTSKKVNITVSDNSQISLTAADDEIVYLRGSTITGLKEGTTTLTAASVEKPEVSATITVNVTENAENRPQLTITGREVVDINDVSTYSATLSKVDAGSYEINYSTSDETVATMSGETFTPVSVGPVMVIATTEYRNVTFTAEFEVTVVRVVDVLFEKSDYIKDLNINEVFDLELTGDFTVEIDGKTYYPDAAGNIQLDRDEYWATNGEIRPITIKQGNKQYTYQMRMYFSVVSGNVYAGAEELVAGEGGYVINKDTVAVDERQLPWVTFNPANEMVEKQYKYLRVTVKFNEFANLNADFVHGNVAGYTYNFGYKFLNTFVYFENGYKDIQIYGGAMDSTQPYGAGEGGWLHIYNTSGDKLMDWEDDGVWSPYIDKLSTNTEYIFEFLAHETGDITANFGLDAVITNVEWSMNDLLADQAVDTTTEAAKLYQNGNEIVAVDGKYTVDSSVAADANGLRWLTVGANDADYKYLRFKVKFSSFEAYENSLTQVPINSDIVANLGALKYSFVYKFNGTVVYGFDTRKADAGYGSQLLGINDATGGYSSLYMNIYNSDGSTKLINALMGAGRSTYYYLDSHTEYIFEFGVKSMGDGFTFAGFDNAEISDIIWCNALLIA